MIKSKNNSPRRLTGKIGLIFTGLLYTLTTFALTNITFWHSMPGPYEAAIKQITAEFNASQNRYRVIPIYKGNYTPTLTTTVAAFRAGEQPDIVQVFEVGTATMIYPAGIIVPVYQLMQDANIPFDHSEFLPAIRYYYSDNEGRLLSMPFNSSSPVMFYNKNMFSKAGLDPSHPPTTWPEVEQAAQKILAAGFACGFTTGWPSWTQIENFSAWHNLPVASENNGFNGVNPQLLYNNPTVVKHIATLANWQKQNIFQYGGRDDDAMSLFTSQRCAMIIESSGWVSSLTGGAAGFPVDIAPLPYWPNIKGAPQNTIIVGATLWALTGHSADVYKGIAEFFAFLASPKIQSQWQQASGYLPVTIKAYQLSQRQGYYRNNPGADVGVKELMDKMPTANTKGLRIGNYMQIRQINDQALEAVFSGQKTAQQALDDAVKEGNRIINIFAKSVSVQ